MRWFAALFASLLLVLPAKADMYQDASNAKLPWNLTTPNDPNLNNGINITSGYSGPIDSSVRGRYWGTQVIYGPEDCEDHMFHFFRYLRGFAYGTASCATQPAGTSVSQFIPGLFSLGSDEGSPGGIPLIAQGFIKGNGISMWGINTLKADTQLVGHTSGTGGSISGTTMTLTSVLKGTFSVGDLVSSDAGTAPNTYIVEQLSGTPGGVGTYRLNYPGTVSAKRITAKRFYTGGLVQDEYDNFCDLNDTRCRNIIDGSFPNGSQASVWGATVGGTITPGDILNITITDGLVTGSPRTVSYTTVPGDTLDKAALGLVAAIHADVNLQATNYYARAIGPLVRIYYPQNNGIGARPGVSFGQSVTGAATETITLALIANNDNQRFALGITTFSGEKGRWQNGFQTGSGCCDFALMVGNATSNSPPGVGVRSQGIKWYYTDNTNGNVLRVATMVIDPANAGATGADVVFDNISGQNTNLALANGNLTVFRPDDGSTTTIGTNVNNGNASNLTFQKGRGGVVAPSVITTGDTFGNINFQGWDGTQYVTGAGIVGQSSGVIGPAAVGGVLAFWTAGARRMYITETGLTGFGPPGAPVAVKPSAAGRLQVRTADDLNFGFIQAKLQADTNYTAGVPVATGYLTLYDAAGTAYKVPACTGC